jgi:hypothetical protein
MRKETWVCEKCGSQITTYVEVVEPPICSRHLKPEQMGLSRSETKDHNGETL